MSFKIMTGFCITHVQDFSREEEDVCERKRWDQEIIRKVEGVHLLGTEVTDDNRSLSISKANRFVHCLHLPHQIQFPCLLKLMCKERKITN